MNNPNIPRLIKQVHIQIEEHPNFKHLDVLTRIGYEEAKEHTCGKQADNKWVRELWNHLYLNDVKPL